IQAARKAGDPRLAEPVSDQLGDAALRGDALEALSQLAEPAVIPLGRRLADRERSCDERVAIAQAVGAIGGERATAALWRQLVPGEDIVVRVAAGHSLALLRERDDSLAIDPAELTERRLALADEIGLCDEARRACGAGDPACAALLGDHVHLQIELLSAL